MKMVKAYVDVLRGLSFKDPNGPSAAMAREIVTRADRDGLAALAAWAEAMRHDGGSLANGAFTQIVTVCALARADRTGSIAPFIRQDISPKADAILEAHGAKF
jgi:hypothetical protein